MKSVAKRSLIFAAVASVIVPAIALSIILVAASRAGAAPKSWPRTAQAPQAAPPAPSAPLGQAPQQPPPQQQPNDQQPNYSISMTVPVVNVDVVVTDNDGNYLTGLKKENFRLTEDGAPQTITNFATTDAPITVVILVEYSRRAYGWYLYTARSWADVFLHQLKPTDWVALESFAMRPNVEVDFTHNISEVEQGLINLVLPTFSESVIYDALIDTMDRLADVKGRKSILVLASGEDTFSRHNLNDAIARLKETDITVYCVGVGEQFALQMDMQGANGSGNLNYLQAQNQLRTFAQLTGGRTWFPRFEGELPGVMGDVAASLRNQYSIAYSPTNKSTDGKYRKIKVELVAADGGPLTVLDQKNKKIKYQIYARQGYVAPKTGAAQLASPPPESPVQHAQAKGMAN
jgi:VWFA-related protein